MRSVHVFLIFGVFLLTWSCAHAEESSSLKKEDIVKEEWAKAAFPKTSFYAPSSSSIEEKVMSEKPLPVSVRAPIEDEKAGAMTTPKITEKDLPAELDKTMTLSGRMKLKTALKLCAVSAGKSLLLGAGVEDRDVSADFVNMAIWRALNTLLYPSGYGFKINGPDLVILARETRVFRLNLPPVTQSFNNSTTNESTTGGTGESQNLNHQTNSSNGGRVRVGAKITVENKSENISFWDDIERNVKIILSPRGAFTLNRAAGVVVAEDDPGSLERLAAFFTEMNSRVSAQIMADVKVLEVELNHEHRLGIDWAALMNKGSLKGVNFTTNFASENFSSGNVMTLTGSVGKTGAGTTADGVGAVIKALEEMGRVEVVSQPRVVMLNNAVANIQVGETRSYVDSASTETTTSGGTITTATLSEVHGGVTLQIVGNISGDDIFLSVTPVVSAIDDIRSISLGQGNKLEAPETSMKSMSTLVKVKNGETVAIGGLITRNRTKNVSGVPILSHIPIIGKAFSYETRKDNRTELVVFITPRKG
ncbi:MAG: secretin N-terminal domain-containing protein [Candidatus Omnitrophica bacterium]|nr:secretin N-terminal domain-containing protein [Candidatus Omnitrophota bacterium]